MNAQNSGLFRRVFTIVLTLTVCILGTTAFADASHGAPGTYTASTAGGTSITNTATATYTFGASPATATSNIVTVYVNQLDSFYIVANDYAGNGTVPATQAVVTAANTAVTLSSYSIYNLSNGPIKLTLGLDAKGATTATLLKSSLTGATGSFQSTPSYYSYAITSGGSISSGVITIPQGATPAVLTVTVTPPAGAAAGAWDIFALTLTDSTVSLSPAVYVVTPYNSSSPIWNTTYAGLDTQVTSEVDVLSGANLGKLQLLDQLCTGVTFATTSVSGGVRTVSGAVSFPAAITWIPFGTANAGQPLGGTVGLANVSANPGECIVYRIILNNPLTATSIPANASISDTLNGNVTFQATPAPVLNGATGTMGAPGVTSLTAIAGKGTVYLQYEVKVN
jgi:hypothetical protein